MQWFDDPEVTIHVTAEEPFIIVLSGNPTTGYTWHTHVDTDYLELLSQEFKPGTVAIGAGGQELFCFRAQQRGHTAIAFEYRRPWTSEPGEQRSFQVVIC
jgi:inhibitor of cysteine peptidase